MSHHLVALALALLSVAARAEPQRPQPYPIVAVVAPSPSADETLIAFRDKLAAVARGRIYGELEPLVRRDDFFWDRDFGHGFDPRKPAVDNLATALALEHRNGSGWERLATLVAEAAVEPLPSRSGVVCAPARPGYDSVAYARLLDTTFTSAIDWAYPSAGQTPVRVAPQRDAAVVATLGPHFVQLLGFEGADSEPAPGRSQWAHVATPDGRTGFVAPASLMSLTTEQLCYMKDQIAGWRIAGYIAGGNWRRSQR